MKLRPWEVFAGVMRTGSLTKAGGEVGISQPAVSQTLRHLEERLGLTLFSRRAGRLMPTADAANLYPKVVALLDQMEALEASARDLRFQVSGELSIACIPTLALSVVPSILVDLRLRWPTVKIRMDVRSSAEALALVRLGSLNIGVVHATADEPGVTVVERSTTAMICVMPAGHPAASHAVLTPELVGEHPVITGREALGDAVDAAFARGGRRRTSFVEVNQSLVACAFASNGLGIALVDPFVNFESFPNLVSRPFVPSILLESRIVVPAGQALGPVAQAFTAALTRALRTGLDR